MLFYRFLMTLLAAWELAQRVWSRDVVGIKARLGRLTPHDKGERIWLHAASNGELASARPVIDLLIAQERHVLITVNTDSALALCQGWALANVRVILAPIDLCGPTRQVMRRWDIRAHITLESDLWPCRILETRGPVIVLGGRLTARSAKGWQRFPELARQVLENVTYLSAQDTRSADRFSRLGLPAAACGPVVDLKAFYTPPCDGPDPELQGAFKRAETWLAASTHDGEDETVLTAHKSALQSRADLKLILAPRHPRRADDIETLIHALGLTCARRSKAADPASAHVYLADTLGEMHLWYALAGVTFIAGSLTDRGGHTPYEPAAFGSAILHGPDTANFHAAYSRLTDAGAAIRVSTADELARAVIDLDTAGKQDALATRARGALRQQADLDTLMHDITGHLDA